MVRVVLPVPLLLSGEVPKCKGQIQTHRCSASPSLPVTDKEASAGASQGCLGSSRHGHCHGLSPRGAPVPKVVLAQGLSRSQGPAGPRAGSRTHTPPAPDEDSSSTWEQSCSYFIVLLISNKIRQKLRFEPGTLFSQEINGKEKGEPGTF